MKILFLFIFYISFLKTSAQDISLTATRQEWASGISWTHGTIYTLSISGDKGSLDQIGFNHTVMDGHCFLMNETQHKHSWERNGLKYISYRFEIVETRYPGDDLFEKDISPSYDGNYVKIEFKNRQMKIPISSIEELFYIAYP